MAPTEEYSRADVRRKFGLSEQRLKSWERQNLIAVAVTYTFSDLIAIKTIIKLRENKIPAREIARALHSLREKLGWINFHAKTAEYYREKIELPFFRHFLKGDTNYTATKAQIFDGARAPLVRQRYAEVRELTAARPAM